MSLSKFNKNLLHVLTILEAIEKIKLYTASFKNAETFFNANDQLEFNAVLNLLITTGEEVKKIDSKLKDKSTNWQAVAALRNELSHNYRGVDLDIIWDIIQNYLDPLKKACLKIIVEIQPNKKAMNQILENSFYKHLAYLKTK